MSDASARVLKPQPPLPGPAPLFAQLRDAIRADILRGTLGPGDRLPSEAALIARFGVSRITVRQALAELQSTGLVQTVNGKGSYVTRPGRGEAHGPLVGILEAMRRRGYRARGRLLSHRVVKANRTVARELDVAPDSPVGAVTVLRYRDEVPFALGTTWCDAALAQQLAEQDLTDQDVASAIEALGHRSAVTRVRVGATLADARRAARLDDTVGAPLLRVVTTSIGWDRRPVAYSETFCRADMMEYRVTLRAGARPPP